ncbi:MAG: hypothetical protein K2G48_01770 [Malacoplasma sp.]|nr:hypothetical protein [Malacoplasma sp.]
MIKQNYTKLDISKLLKKLGIKTNRIYLYAEALTHNSYNNEKKVGYTYQRLEFLGDAIISKLISVFLFNYKNEKNMLLNEQEMTEKRKNLVNSEIFKKASEELDLLSYAFIGKGIDLEKDTKKIKTDLFESIAGAIFIDKGEEEVLNFLKKTILKYFEKGEFDSADYKSLVQELFQSNISSGKKKKSGTPYYNNVELENGEFKSFLMHDDIVYGIGFGKTKKDAEKDAAKKTYEKYIEAPQK